MKIETLAIHGASLTVYLRDAEEVMPMAQARPLVLVVRGAATATSAPGKGTRWRSAFWQRGTTRRCCATA